MYYFTFKPYQRHFIRPLQTHYGLWKIREGIIIHLQDEQGNIQSGEIAPLPWFGSESWQDALTFCQKLHLYLTKDQILSIPDNLPSCQFGFESALMSLNRVNSSSNYSYLLPTGKEALNHWKIIYEKNIQKSKTITFKWKIGVDSLQVELNLWEQLMKEFPKTIKLRLDANGSLTLEEAQSWLNVLDQQTQIEFLEQPLPVSEFKSMLALSQHYKTPLALDESVSNLSQLEQCYLRGWKGVFVIKAAIIGYPSRLSALLQNYSLDCVFSSVFETEIGRQAVLSLAQELGNPVRALGFGVNHWFMS